MKMKLWHQITLSSLIALSSATGAWAHADIFSDYSLDDAKQQAQKDHKFLLIDFTATWCPPCKMMEKSTWTDDAVQAWIKENAIAVQIDVDKDRKATSALNVEAMPTLVLFTPQSASKEFGRQVGFTSASELLQWLEGAKSGKTADQIETEQVDSGGEDVFARISKARVLQSAGQNAEALEEYIWLWSNIRKDDPNLGDLRISMLPYEMKNLIAALPTAKDKFVELRDAAEKADDRKDWIVLNGVLDDTARTLAWFDKVKTDPKQRDDMKKLTALLERVLFSTGRYADAVNFLYPEPLAKINDYYKQAQDMKKPRPDTEIAKDFDPFPPMVLLLYGAYVGAGRDAEAQKIADECLRLDDTPSMREGLTNMAKGMRVARDLQTKSTQTKGAK